VRKILQPVFRFVFSFLENLNFLDFLKIVSLGQIVTMVVISYAIIRDFVKSNPQATDVMNNWYRVATKANWSNFHEIKRMFSNSVDAIGNDRFVFNIGGGNYRIIAIIFFDVRTMYIRFVGRHTGYDKLKNASTV